MGIQNKSYIVTMSGKAICVIYATGYYALMIQEDMRNEHFESIFGLPISIDTKELEKQYQEEYVWDCLEIDSLSSQDAELRSISIMERKTIDE